jgi:hypothetical protein
MRLDRLDAHSEQLADLALRVAEHDQLEDLILASREHVQVGRDRDLVRAVRVGNLERQR